jgi:hypothetical protein
MTGACAPWKEREMEGDNLPFGTAPRDQLSEPVSLSGLTALEEVERHIKLCGPDPYVKIGIDRLRLIRAALLAKRGEAERSS